ncbi:MAG: restriction endonuclease [Dokdonella sp.]|uniref:restriction endonuclease n=1 Tax=Dokdonella sp. TaxID=2291710 RepID=UPI003F81596E
MKYNRTRWNDALSRVDATRFEALVADHYRTEGWSVDHVGTGATGQEFDGGIDLKLRRGDAYIVVQCKRWDALKVTHNVVHELIGVMMTQRATGAVVVTSGEFTRAALEAACREPRIQLVDGVMVREWIDLAALEAEERRQPSDGSVGADDWTHVFTERETHRRPTSRPRSDNGAPLIAIVATIAFAAFLAFVFLPLRQGTPSTTVSATATTRAQPLSVPQASANTPPPATFAPTSTPAPTPARAGYLTQVAQPVNRAVTEYLRQAGVPDVSRPVDHEAARMAAKAVAGVRSALWLDHDNFVVMVDGAQYRSMAMIDEVCDALEPLGDTLGVVVNVQDITAQHADGATTLSRNCQLPEGQRALLQRKRQVDVVAPETRALFKGQQPKK